MLYTINKPYNKDFTPASLYMPVLCYTLV